MNEEFISFLSDISGVSNINNVNFGDLTLDSREIIPGDCFIALNGVKQHGLTFSRQAIKNGAKAIVYEAEGIEINDFVGETEGVLLLPVLGLKDKLAELAKKFYGNPSDKLKLIGITGTNGKTSCSHFAAECLNQKYKSAVMGTIGNGIVGHLKQSSHTTLDIISINKMLNDFSKDDVKNVVMEVSSHGLDQGRVAELKFQTAVFTNLTRDHLDYHKTTENYAKCKLKLFAMKDLKNAVVNVDDPFSQTILDHLNHQINVIVYGIKWVKTDKNYVFARDITFEPNGMVVNFTSSWGDGVFNTKLLGDFNVSNLLAVLGILFCSGITVDKAINYIQSVNNVAGRMEKFTANNLPKVIVDYAHTPDALEKALKTLNSHCDGKIWCVFGCGGSRDQGKRKIMGAIAEQMCDQIVLTDDNPREEQSEKIIEDILLGMINKPMVIIKQDRRQAIEYAVTNADMNDFVLVAGKGHENYQEINGRRLPYSDREIVSNLGMLN